ncbi:MAG: hypothetical protein H5U04_05255 [Firmicutes bacterium]|nr:hypothetical protein [Bacillota bacterium]
MLWADTHRWRFVYRPAKLEAAVEEISRRHNSVAVMERRRRESSSVDVQSLLETLTGAPSDEALQEIALSLSTREITALFFALPKVQEAEAAVKVAKVIIWRPQRCLLVDAWPMFKGYPRHPGSRMLVAEVLARGVGPDLPERYRVLVQKSVGTDDPAGAMAAELLLAEDLLFSDLIRNMDVEPDCTLAVEILQYYMLGSTKKHFLREGGALLASYARSLRMSPFKRFTERYLLEMEPTFFQEEVASLILERLGKPGDPHNRRWEGIDEEARRKFQRWLVESDLKQFFEGIAGDRARWEYWARYSDKIQDVTRHDDPPILVMHFLRGVAVEFGQPGNAAYLYTHEVWNVIYHDHLCWRTVWRPQDLKYREWCVGRIEHRGWWELEADDVVERIL